MADDFVVITEECMFCGYPPVVAPNLMGMRTDDAGYPSCYFRRQPENDLEIDETIAGVNASCCGAVMYVGTDRKIRKKMESYPDGPPPRLFQPMESIVSPVISERPWITTPKQGFFARLFKRQL